jgi:hypothetical protein
MAVSVFYAWILSASGRCHSQSQKFLLLHSAKLALSSRYQIIWVIDRWEYDEQPESCCKVWPGLVWVSKVWLLLGNTQLLSRIAWNVFFFLAKNYVFLLSRSAFHNAVYQVLSLNCVLWLSDFWNVIAFVSNLWLAFIFQDAVDEIFGETFVCLIYLVPLPFIENFTTPNCPVFSFLSGQMIFWSNCNVFIGWVRLTLQNVTFIFYSTDKSRASTVNFWKKNCFEVKNSIKRRERWELRWPGLVWAR